MPNPVHHAAITFDAETGKFGFKVWAPKVGAAAALWSAEFFAGLR